MPSPFSISDTHWINFAERCAHTLNRPLDDSELTQFKLYAHHLLTWNEKFNLIGPAPPESILIRHFLDSLYFAPLLPPSAKIADIGSGAGFPGVPLAIVFPQHRMHLIESIQKKAGFLSFIVAELGLHNKVKIFNQRAEQMPSKEINSYHVILSRALSDIAQGATWAFKLLKPDGMYLTIKGPKVDQDLEKYYMNRIHLKYARPQLHTILGPNEHHSILVKLQRI
ncbi:MAG: 16S rRNA (guanine(527)-N(7))-methyltransferase RsmG [Magnetococcus sp. DMHC-6]